jgi:acetylglutamate kinase
VSRLVVKVGGAVAAESASRILGLREEGHEVCVVHGAGRQITEEMTRRGIAVEFVNGRRRTTRAGLEVVRESMAAVNAELCAALGELAAPIFGDRDGLLAVPVPPLAVGPLNVNADDAATAIALGLGARRLVFLTDVAGLYVDDEVVDAIDVGSANAMLDAGLFDGGIVPKLRAAAVAAGSGITAQIGRTAVVA